jgi:hypothetical protein
MFDSIPAGRSGILPRALLVGAMLAGATASTSANERYRFTGHYRIGIEATGLAAPAGQCLIKGDSGRGAAIRHRWTEPGARARWCGFGSVMDFFENGQGIFEVRAHVLGPQFPDAYTIEWNGQCLIAKDSGIVDFGGCSGGISMGPALWYIDTDVRLGSTVYASIRSVLTNQCVVFGRDGADEQPTLYRWTKIPADVKYCGLGPNALTKAGVGLFTFTRIAEGL